MAEGNHTHVVTKDTWMYKGRFQYRRNDTLALDPRESVKLEALGVVRRLRTDESTEATKTAVELDSEKREADEKRAADRKASLEERRAGNRRGNQQARSDETATTGEKAAQTDSGDKSSKAGAAQNKK